MREIGSFEAKNRLSELLTAVENGEEITILRRGRPIAKLVGIDGAKDRKRALAAVARMAQLRKGATLGGTATLKELIEEGRR